MVWFGFGLVWFGLVWFGSVWFWFGLVWFGMVWFGSVWIGSVHSFPSFLSFAYSDSHASFLVLLFRLMPR